MIEMTLNNSALSNLQIDILKKRERWYKANINLVHVGCRRDKKKNAAKYNLNIQLYKKPDKIQDWKELDRIKHYQIICYYLT